MNRQKKDDADAGRARQHLPEPTRPWNVPGVRVDAVVGSPGERVGGATASGVTCQHCFERTELAACRGGVQSPEREHSCHETVHASQLSAHAQTASVRPHLARALTSARRRRPCGLQAHQAGMRLQLRRAPNSEGKGRTFESNPHVLHVCEFRGNQCGVHVEEAAVLGLHANGQAERKTLMVIVPGDADIGQPPHGLVAVANRHGDALLLDMHEDLHFLWRRRCAFVSASRVAEL